MNEIKEASGPSVDAEQTPRARVLAGMAAAIGERGYPATTIADIVAHAAVSKRTFYEHFDSKAECLIALYEVVNEEGLGVLAACLSSEGPWRGRVEQALTAYFDWMAGNPRLMQSLFIDIVALGPAGLAVRRRVHERIASFIVDVEECSPDGAPELSHALSAALGGRHP